ncbi:MAG: hypothetical protein Phog2KO_47900 [Phototrophicaceae bacterium]
MITQHVFTDNIQTLQRNEQVGHVFIAHDFFGANNQRRRDYRLPIREALQDSGFVPVFPDEIARPGTLLSTICQHILDVEISIFDVSTLNENVLIELGLAIGMNRPFLVIANDSITLPDELLALDPLRYEIEEDLEATLGDRLKGRLRETGNLGAQCTVCGNRCVSRRRQVIRDSYTLIGTNDAEKRMLKHTIKVLLNAGLSPVEAEISANTSVCALATQLQRSQIGLFYLIPPYNSAKHIMKNIGLGIAIGMCRPWMMILSQIENDVGERVDTTPPTDLKGQLHVKYVGSTGLYRGTLENSVKALLLSSADYSGVFDVIPIPEEEFEFEPEESLQLVKRKTTPSPRPKRQKMSASLSREHIAVNYVNLEQIASTFANLVDSNEHLLRNLQRKTDELQANGWIGHGADVFFNEITDDVFPRMQRLIEALDESNRTVYQISQMMADAEDEASNLFKN